MQVPKEEVREAFIAVAAQTFAELGYAATTMATIAERAGSSIGNLYKYFGSKRELFEAAVPPELVHELMKRTRARMRALGSAKDVRELGTDAQYHALAGDLLDYCLEHRAAVVVVLSRAEGTPYATFAREFIQKLTNWAFDYAEGPYPRVRRTPAMRFCLEHGYASFIAAISEALRQFPDDADARALIALLTSQHQAGLKRLFETQGEPDAHSRYAQQSAVIAQTSGPRIGNAAAARADSGAAGARVGQADRTDRPRRRR